MSVYYICANNLKKRPKPVESIGSVNASKPMIFKDKMGNICNIKPLILSSFLSF